jgi:lysophospholipase L1-like esterase
MNLKHIACVLLAASAGAAMARDPITFDLDGRADPGVNLATTAVWSVLYSSSGGTSNLQWGWREARPVIGDFTGDGRTDAAVYHRAASNWYIRNSTTGLLDVRHLGLHQGRPIPADFDGDGTTDLAVYQWEGGMWLVRRSSDQGQVLTQFGFPDARPIPGDFDGDGADDRAVFHRDTAIWYILGSSAGYQQIQFGWRDVRPVAADFDGDGADDLAVYHAATGNWYIRQSSTLQMVVRNWGWKETEPVPDDYDGDGEADLAVYHRRTGTWYIFQSSNNQMRQFVLGGPNYCPLAAYRDGAMAGLYVLSFGDSITYGMGSSKNGPRSGYPILLETVAEPLFGGHYISINAGKSGESTSSGRSRIKTVLQTYEPDVSLLMEGVNDTFYNQPNSSISANLKSMIDACRADGSAVILSTLTPVIKSAYRDRSAQEQRIESFNPNVPGIAASRNIAWVDNWKAITDRPNWASTLIEQSTANHPNDAGYAIMREVWLRALLEGKMAGRYY